MTEKWGFDIKLLPGGPPLERLHHLFRLLVGDSVLLEAERLDNERLDTADPASFVAERYASALSASAAGIDMFLHGPGDTYVSIDYSLRSNSGSSITGYVPEAEPGVLLERVSSIFDEMEAMFAAVFVGERKRNMLGRNAAHREATKAEHGQAAFPFWIRWGLPGLAWRSMLGRPFIEQIGEDRLHELGSDLAWPVGDHWVVAGCDDPAEWTVDPMCSQERSLIDQLGPEHFFDIDTEALPTCLPDLPPHPSFPVLLKDPEPESRPAKRTAPVPTKTDSTARLEAKSAWVVQRMTEMIPDFEDDAQLYWVEEFLRDSAAADHDYLVDLYGAWLGEYLRKAIDGAWVESPDGWMVRSPDGATHDPHGRMRAYLEDNTAELDPWIRSITDPG